MRPKSRSATVGLQHDHLLAGQLGAAEHAPGEQGAALDLHVVLVGPEHHDLLGALALILDPLERLHPHSRVADLRAVRAMALGVASLQRPAGSGLRRAGGRG